MQNQIIISVLQNLYAKLSDLTPIYRAISQELKDAVEENFEKEGRPKWTALAKSTIRQRLRLGYWPGKILQRRGGGDGLLGSIHARYDSQSAQVGTNKIYAPIHQFGGTIKITGRKTSKKSKSHTIRIPARPFLSVTPSDIEAIKSLISKLLLK